MYRSTFYFFVVLWGSLTFVRALLGFLMHPLTFFHQKKRENSKTSDFMGFVGGFMPSTYCNTLSVMMFQALPEILQDSSYGTHKYVTANGIKFHYVANGTEGNPLMLFLHGFPEFWFSWRFQLLEFSKDYYAVAVDLRGYGDTERPANKKDYGTRILVQDIAELIPALGYKSCVLVCHDWGGIMGWRLAQSHSELVDHLIALNSTHLEVYINLIHSTWRQKLSSWYIFMMQVPYLPEILIKCRDFVFVEDAFLSEAMGARNKTGFSKEVIEAYKYNFSQPGACTAAINYYRNLSLVSSRPRHNVKIEIPVLMIWGDDDLVLARDLPDKHDTLATNLVVKHIPNCSHWVQQDRPDLVNQYMQEFLQNDAS